VKAIGDALDVPVMRPNIACFGQATWTALRRHPKIVQACNAPPGRGHGVAPAVRGSLRAAAGPGRPGLPQHREEGPGGATSRVWGKHAAFIYRDRAAGPQAGVTFGYNGRFGDKIAGTIDEPKIGLKGCQRVRVGERTKEVISANDLAYFFQNAVA
jgi:hypothetical protein